MKYFVSTILLLLFCLPGYSQANSAKSFYKDILMDGDHLYAINSKGKIAVWNLHSLESHPLAIDTTIVYTCIAKDRNNDIYAGTGNGLLMKLNKSNFSFSKHSQLKKDVSIHNIFFTSQNKMFLVIPNGVYDPIHDKIWNKFRLIETAGMVVSRVKKFFFYYYTGKPRYVFTLPQFSYVDSNDKIWMANTFGEFGTWVNVFDTNRQKELKPDIFESYGLLHLQSIFEDDKKNIYVTSGLQHFMNSGSIYKIVNGKAVIIFDSRDYKLDADEGDLYIGPGTFNVKDQKLYFATQKGIYRSLIPQSGKIDALEKVFSPELLYNRENLAIGIEMAIKKMEFTNDNRLIFLTENNGIGIYNGKEVITLD